MDVIHSLLHIDKALSGLLAHYGSTGVYTVYAMLAGVLFAETGLVVTPFLPGDSLLFAIGSFCGAGTLQLHVSYPLLFAAVLLGDNTNYWIGRVVGPKIFSRDDVKLLNRQHLDRTHAFFEKYGSKAVIYARFVPFVRTFMPFVAGIGRMSYPRFLCFSMGGCLLWLSVCMLSGYFFGGLSFVRNNFSVVVLVIIALSLLPVAVEYLRHRSEVAKAAAQG